MLRAEHGLLYKFQPYRRLKKNKDFRSVLSKSQKVSQAYLLAVYQTNDRPNARLGVAVSKRVAKLAVARNRIKRVIRESFRLSQNQLPTIDIVVIVRSEGGNADKKRLRETIDKLWKKLTVPLQLP